MNQPLIVFDMDGVLVDVTESYRESIAQTVKHFTGVDVTPEHIQDYKNQGGWNDDWKLSHHIITQAGKEIPFETAKDYFQSIFLGNGEGGLILREEWVARAGLLEELNRQFEFAVFTMWEPLYVNGSRQWHLAPSHIPTRCVRCGRFRTGCIRVRRLAGQRRPNLLAGSAARRNRAGKFSLYEQLRFRRQHSSY